MDALINIPELIREFVTRQDYIGVYLIAVGLWCSWFAVRGLHFGATKNFGWRAGEVWGDGARTIGRAWLAIALALAATGTGLWVTA